MVTGWTREPFRLTIEGDKGYGLGAYDMKGGLAVAIKTFLEFEPKNIGLKLLLCVDEENISRGGHKLVNSEYIRNVECVLSSEPAFSYGINGIVTGRIGRAVFEIDIESPSKHFMFYEIKSDIISAFSQFALELNNLLKIDGEKRQFAFVRNIHAESIGMSTPGKISAEIDCAILPPMTNDKMLQELNRLLKKILETQIDDNVSGQVKFKERETPFLSCYEIDSKDKYLIEMSKSIKLITGNNAQPYFRSSVADENIFGSMGIPVIGVGPTGDGAHSRDEYVNLPSLFDLKKIYTEFLRSADESFA